MLRYDGNNQLKPDKNILQNMGKTNGTLLKLRSVIRENIFSICRILLNLYHRATAINKLISCSNKE